MFGAVSVGIRKGDVEYVEEVKDCFECEQENVVSRTWELLGDWFVLLVGVA